MAKAVYWKCAYCGASLVKSMQVCPSCELSTANKEYLFPPRIIMNTHKYYELLFPENTSSAQQNTKHHTIKELQKKVAEQDYGNDVGIFVQSVVKQVILAIGILLGLPILHFILRFTGDALVHLFLK